jgi:hypothetical protein
VEIGLADLHRRRGALATASELITPILPRLPSDSANGWDALLRANVVCVQILRAAADPGAERILDQGLQLLDTLAQNIGDQRLRRSFLQTIPAHHELRALRATAKDGAQRG